MTEYPILHFPSAKDLDKWLAKNYAKSKGIWLRLFKKDSGVTSITRNEAIIEALCYGWIDGQANKYDEQSWLQKITPRRPKSIWSKRNPALLEITKQPARLPRKSTEWFFCA